MNYPGDLFSDVELLKSLANLSDEISFDRFHAQDLQVETKPDATPVTDADRAVEKKIREHLLKERPLDKIIGEEFGSPDEITSGERYWVRWNKEFSPRCSNLGYINWIGTQR
jgi:histidinol-phosphatase